MRDGVADMDGTEAPWYGWGQVYEVETKVTLGFLGNLVFVGIQIMNT